MKINVLKLFSLEGHKDCIYSIEGGETDNIFYSSGGDGMIVKWDMSSPENGQLMASMKNSVYAMCYLKEQNNLLVGQNFEGIHCIDLHDKKEVWSLKISNTQIFDLKKYNDKVFIGVGDGTLFIVDLQTKSFTHKIKISDKSIRAIAINEVLGEIALGLSDHSIRILSLTDYSQKYKINAHSSSVFSVVYNPINNVLLSAGRDAHIKSWNSIDHYTLDQSIPAHMYAINSLAISPDQKYFVSASMDKSIKVWDLDAIRLLKVIDKSRHAGHATSVNKVIWTSYKNQVVSCSDDKKISLWDLSFN